MGEIHEFLGFWGHFYLPRRRIDFSICDLLHQVFVGKFNKHDFKACGIADSLPKTGSQTCPSAIRVFQGIGWLLMNADA